jgi:hypothetical protein
MFCRMKAWPCAVLLVWCGGEVEPLRGDAEPPEASVTLDASEASREDVAVPDVVAVACVVGDASFACVPGSPWLCAGADCGGGCSVGTTCQVPDGGTGIAN